MCDTRSVCSREVVLQWFFWCPAGKLPVESYRDPGRWLGLGAVYYVYVTLSVSFREVVLYWSACLGGMSEGNRGGLFRLSTGTP